MKRREFITLIGAGALAAPRLARAQEMRRIGVLMGYADSDPEAQAWVAAFREELRNVGWVEGRTVQIDIRWAKPGDPEAIQRFAQELAALQPELILSSNTPATAAMLKETRTIPLVFAIVADPVRSGFVASFPRPGGNVTGFIMFEPTIAGKWLELLKETAPRISRAAFLFNPAATYAEDYLGPFKAAAPSFAVEAITAPVRDPSELESIIAAQARVPNSGLIVLPDPLTVTRRAEITSLAVRHGLPTVSGFRFFTEAGGLLAYANDFTDNFRRAAAYADRILKGAKPAELPVQAPTTFQLVINLKTAKALDLTISPSLLARADELID